MALDIFTEATQQEILTRLKKTNVLLGVLANAEPGSYDISSWEDVQGYVRSGLAAKIFQIGDQFTCYKSGTLLTWDIIGIDCDTPADSQYTHSLTLQLHDCYTSLQYDAPEAFYYCADGLAAGTYYFTMAAAYSSWAVGDYQFTLTEDVPAGGQLKFSSNAGTALDSCSVQVFASNATTSATETASITSGSDGTFLGTIQTSAVQDAMNCAQRASYGSNNWAESPMRQYLNSDAAAGSVWTPQTIFDRYPSWVSNTAGFMNGLDEDFLAVVGAPTKVTARSTVSDGGGYDTTEDLFFLLSRSEVYAGTEVSGINEGEPYPYYSDYSDLSAAGTGADTNRIKYRNGSAQYWWLRTPNASSGFHVRTVNTTGTLNNSTAHITGGVAPACCII